MTVVMKESRGFSGPVTWTFPKLEVDIPSKKEIAKRVVDIVAKRLKASLGREPSNVSGLASWLAARIQTTQTAITYPNSSSIERLELGDIEPEWVEEALREVMSEVIK